jgi:hypothetical protein
MIRSFTLVSMLMAGGSVLYLYEVKHQGQILDREIAMTIKQTKQTRESINVLQAEWAVLSGSDRISELAKEQLGLRAVEPSQFVALDDLGSRLPEPVTGGRPNPAHEPEPAPAPALAQLEPARPAAPMPSASLRAAPDRAAIRDPAKPELRTIQPQPQPQPKPPPPSPAQAAAAPSPVPRAAVAGRVTPPTANRSIVVAGGFGDALSRGTWPVTSTPTDPRPFVPPANSRSAYAAPAEPPRPSASQPSARANAGAGEALLRGTRGKGAAELAPHIFTLPERVRPASGAQRDPDPAIGSQHDNDLLRETQRNRATQPGPGFLTFPERWRQAYGPRRQYRDPPEAVDLSFNEEPLRGSRFNYAVELEDPPESEPMRPAYFGPQIYSAQHPYPAPPAYRTPPFYSPP